MGIIRMFGRQHNLYGWILSAPRTGGKTFDAAATDTEFFTGRRWPPAISCSLEEATKVPGMHMRMPISPMTRRTGRATGKITTRFCLGRVPKDAAPCPGGLGILLLRSTRQSRPGIRRSGRRSRFSATGK